MLRPPELLKTREDREAGRISATDLSKDEAASVLRPFEVLCTVRERMSLPRSLSQRLPNLKLVTIIGMSLRNLNMAAATEHGVSSPIPTLPTHIDLESRRMREGHWLPSFPADTNLSLGY